MPEMNWIPASWPPAKVEMSNYPGYLFDPEVIVWPPSDRGVRTGRYVTSLGEWRYTGKDYACPITNWMPFPKGPEATK